MNIFSNVKFFLIKINFLPFFFKKILERFYYALASASFGGGDIISKKGPSINKIDNSAVQPEVTIRKDFPETWLWNELNINRLVLRNN